MVGIARTSSALPADSPAQATGSLLTPALAALLLLAFSPSVHATYWSPKAAVVLLLAAVGLPRVVSLWHTPGLRAPAAAALALLAIATVSTVSSDDPRQAVVGLYGQGTGLLFVAGLVGAWALGAVTDGGGRHRARQAVVAGVVASGLVGVVELFVDLDTAGLGLVDGRAPGLAGNPVHLAALGAGLVALGALDAAGTQARWGLGLVGVGAVIVQCSGSRLGLLATTGAAGWVVISRRSWTALGPRLAVALIAGGLVGMTLAGLADAHSSTDRLTSGGSSGITSRWEAWATARSAIAERPLFGSGPGRFRAATSPQRTVALARAEGPDRLFTDAHNLVVEYTTTTGVLGAAALIAWLGLVLRRSRGPLAAFGAVVLAMGLLQPQSVATTPLALLALGAAGPRAATTRPSRATARATTVGRGALVVVAVGAGAVLLVGDRAIEVARLDFRLDVATDAIELVGFYPEPHRRAAAIERFEAASSGGLSGPAAADARAAREFTHLAEARRHQEEAIRRSPDDPTAWIELGEIELVGDNPSSAARHFLAALERDPQSVRARQGLATAATALGDDADAAHWAGEALDIAPELRWPQAYLS